MLPGRRLAFPASGPFALAALSPWTAPPLRAPSILEGLREAAVEAAPSECVSGGRHHLNSLCCRLFNGLWGPLPSPTEGHVLQAGAWSFLSTIFPRTEYLV